MDSKQKELISDMIEQIVMDSMNDAATAVAVTAAAAACIDNDNDRQQQLQPPQQNHLPQSEAVQSKIIVDAPSSSNDFNESNSNDSNDSHVDDHHDADNNSDDHSEDINDDDDDDELNVSKKNNKKRHNSNRNKPQQQPQQLQKSPNNTANNRADNSIKSPVTIIKQQQGLKKSSTTSPNNNHLVNGKSPSVIDDQVKAEKSNQINPGKDNLQSQSSIESESESQELKIENHCNNNNISDTPSTDDKDHQQELNSIDTNLDTSDTDNNTNTNEMKMNGTIRSYGSNNHMNNGYNNGSNYGNGNSSSNNHLTSIIINDSLLCKICSKHVYHMEQIKAVKSIFHKSCFRCIECNKQLSMDSYSSHEGQLYCKSHFKQLFQPKPNFNNISSSNSNGNCSNMNGNTATTNINGNTTTDMVDHDHMDHNTMDIIDDDAVDAAAATTKSLINSSDSTEDNKPQQQKPTKRPSSPPSSSKKYEVIICENQPIELPPDVVRYNSKQQDVFENLTLDLSNIRNRFETGSIANSNNHNHNNNHHQPQSITRSESIHKIMQKYQSRVAGDNSICSSSDEEGGDDSPRNNDTNNNNNFKEKLSLSTDMSSLKSQWESGNIKTKEAAGEQRTVENELAELRRSKSKTSEPLIKQFERAIAQSTENLSSTTNGVSSSQSMLNKSEPLLNDCHSVNAGTIKEKFEKVSTYHNDSGDGNDDRIERLRKEREAEIIQITANEQALKEARNKFKKIELGQIDDNHNNHSNGHSIESIDSKELQQRFNYFENRDDIDNVNDNHNNNDSNNSSHHHSSVKIIDDIPKVDTTKKMLNKFKQLEQQQMNGDNSNNVGNGGGVLSPKMPKRITPPRETTKIYENEPLVDPNIVKSSYKSDDVIQVEPEKAKHLRAKFENWQSEIAEHRENNHNNDSNKHTDDNEIVQLVEQRDMTKNLRAMFESIQNETNKPIDKPRPRVNRFVQEKTYQQYIDSCYVCSTKIYPMEKMEFSGIKLHKNCFRCAKCHMPMRLDNFTQHADKLFCIPHFKQLFMEKGNYDEGFGMEQHKDKWSNKAKPSTTNGKQQSVDNDNTNINNNQSTNGHHDDDEDEIDGNTVSNGHHDHQVHHEERDGHDISTTNDEQLDSTDYVDDDQHHQIHEHQELIEDYVN